MEPTTTESRKSFGLAMAELFANVYRGVPVPERYRIEWGKELTEALIWREGVDAALDHEVTGS